VWQLTGVRVKETLPDQVLLEADSLVVTCPQGLLGRLKEGKVYVPHQAKAALQSFFSLNNLTALRELAMQTAASHVERICSCSGRRPARPRCRCGAS
jgi:two-component system sensor histidine kinase KdpD